MSAGGLVLANENAVPMHCVATWDWHVIYWHEVTQETVTKLFPARGFEAGYETIRYAPFLWDERSHDLLFGNKEGVVNNRLLAHAHNLRSPHPNIHVSIIHCRVYHPR